MEKETKEINTKIEKFEKVKEFRDLNSLKLINKDNSTISLNEKFKDFQEIYSLITRDIKTNDKKWIFSKKDKIYYIFSFITSLNTLLFLAQIKLVLKLMSLLC